MSNTRKIRKKGKGERSMSTGQFNIDEYIGRYRGIVGEINGINSSLTQYRQQIAQLEARGANLVGAANVIAGILRDAGVDVDNLISENFGQDQNPPIGVEEEEYDDVVAEGDFDDPRKVREHIDRAELIRRLRGEA